jgi:hypothetical protein
LIVKVRLGTYSDGMDKTLDDTIESYRNKADGLRAICEAMTDPLARTTLMNLVATYHRLIECAVGKRESLPPRDATFSRLSAPLSISIAVRRSTLGKAAYFRARADEARAMADGISDARARSSMRRVGDDYDKIADSFEREPRQSDLIAV